MFCHLEVIIVRNCVVLLRVAVVLSCVSRCHFLHVLGGAYGCKEDDGTNSKKKKTNLLVTDSCEISYAAPPTEERHSPYQCYMCALLFYV